MAATSSTGDDAPNRRDEEFPPVLSKTDLARLLKRSRRTIDRWDRAGKLPVSSVVGRQQLWIFSDVMAWLSSGAPTRKNWERSKSSSHKKGGKK